MPLFGASGSRGKAKARTRMKNRERTCMRTDDNGSVLSLTRFCLLSLTDNMKDVWVKDYADNYMDHYFFRHIMGPFNSLPGELVEELILLLCDRKQMSRAALHLLMVPQLRRLSLEKSPALVTPVLCNHITARCQGLRSLNLSGAQQLPSKIMSETLSCLPALQSLTLAGTTCDKCVIKTIARCCRLLRNLDVSGCHFLSPAALLPLGGGKLSSPPTLRSLLALDIGFGEEEGDPMAAAAYILLSLPSLERFAMEGISEAGCLIQHGEFNQTDWFADREGVPRLDEVLRSRWSKKSDVRDDEKEMWEESGSESEEVLSTDEVPSCSQSREKKKKSILSRSGDGCLILSLRDVKVLSCDSLESFSRLCRNIDSISVNIDHGVRGRSQGSLLATGLKMWSGQLRSLSVHYSGPVVDLLPAVQISGSSLLSLTLEAVRASTHTPLLEVIMACPRLRDLHMSADPPIETREEEEDIEELQDDPDLPCLPDLCSLTIKFSYEHSQMKPVMFWMSLKRALNCLLRGSPLLEKLSLVSLPCPLNGILEHVVSVADYSPLLILQMFLQCHLHG